MGDPFTIPSELPPLPQGFPQIPIPSPGGSGPGGIPNPNFPTVPGGGGTTPSVAYSECQLDDGTIGWTYTPGGPCFPYPGESPPGGGGAPVPGGGSIPLPGGGGGLPIPGGGAPSVPGGVPGLVTEAECSARAQSAAANAKAAEESKAWKYALISALASGAVGIALAKLV